MRNDYIRFDIQNIPPHEYSILLEKCVQIELINKALSAIGKKTGGWGKYKRLAIYLKQKCRSLQNIKLSSISDSYLFNWQKCRLFIPIDCVIELYKLIEEKLDENKISFIRYRTINGCNYVYFPHIYNEDLAFLGEAIRVEGHIKKDLNQTSIGNKNLIFLKKLKKIVIKYVKKDSIYEIFQIEADIPNKKVMGVRSKDKIFKSRTYFASKSNKKKIKFYDKIRSFPIYYTIKLSDNSKISIKIDNINNELVSTSTYGVVSSILNLSICNTTFTRLLNLLLEIPKGKKTEIIKIPEILKNSLLSVKNEAINAILDSEGWIEGNRVRIGMNSRQYLEDIKEIFKSFGIEVTIENKRSTLSINSIKELKNLAKYFKFSSKKKDRELNKVIKKKSSLKRGEGIKLILNILKDKNNLTNKEISSYRNKHIDTIYKQLSNSINKGLIKKNIDYWPYKYCLTQKGLNVFIRGDKI